MNTHQLLLLVLVAFCTFIRVESFDVPSDKVRGELKAAIADEDVIVMQAEMQWGAQEMQRYRALRGTFPVRSALTGEGADNQDTSIVGLFRGGSNSQPAEGGSDAQEDYWKYLISMF